MGARPDRRPSSIDRIGCASYVAGSIRAQPDYHLGDLIWLAEPAQWRPGSDLISPFPLCLGGHRRPDETRTYRIHPDTVVGILQGGRLSQTDDAMLRSHVSGAVGQTPEPEDRTGVDDRPATLSLHLEYFVFHAEPD